MQISSLEMKRFNYLVGEIDAVYHDAALKLGLSDSVSSILYALCDAGRGIPLNLLCRRTGISKQTVNSALRALERDGIVRLEAVDGKAKRVCLTEAGEIFAGRTAARLIEIENEIFASWPREEVAQYLALTERYLCAFREKVGRMTKEP